MFAYDNKRFPLLSHPWLYKEWDMRQRSFPNLCVPGAAVNRGVDATEWRQEPREPALRGAERARAPDQEGEGTSCAARETYHRAAAFGGSELKNFTDEQEPEISIV